MRRSVLAAIVLLACGGALLAAWYVSSRRAHDAEMRLGFQQVQRVTLENERDVADRLARRLETLRVNESLRPYFHYQNLYHDPQGASQGLSVVPSPLAQGSAHPLVTAYFQIDAKNRVSLPTLNDELRELNAPDVARQRAIRDAIAQSTAAIEEAAAPLVARIEKEATAARRSAARIAELEAQLAASKQTKVAEGLNIQRLEPFAVAQNYQSNEVYRQLRSAPQAQAPAVAPVLPPRPRPVPPIDIRSSDLEWRTVAIKGSRALIALRAVHTPSGTLVQGFLTPLADGASVEGAVVRRSDVRGASIGGTGWRAQLARPAPASRDAAQERFQRMFIAAAVALLLVVTGIVWTLSRVERLATDRARFAATAAHELRTPLASLRLYSDLISNEPDEATRERYAREIAGQTERLGRVVANVLEVTRLERGTFALEPQPGEIGRAVEECIARLQPQMEAANCPIELRVASDLPEVAFDSDALHHVVDNLVDNAEKFSRDVADRTISVDVAAEEGGVAITVSDRGPGVPEELLRDPRPYRRGDASSAISGLGLGLFLVDRIVRGHGGALRTLRRDGGGASVRVFLPAFYKP